MILAYTFRFERINVEVVTSELYVTSVSVKVDSMILAYTFRFEWVHDEVVTSELFATSVLVKVETITLESVALEFVSVESFTSEFVDVELIIVELIGSCAMMFEKIIVARTTRVKNIVVIFELWKFVDLIKGFQVQERNDWEYGKCNGLSRNFLMHNFHCYCNKQLFMYIVTKLQ